MLEYIFLFCFYWWFDLLGCFCLFCIDLVVDDFYGLFGCEYVKKVYFDDVFCIVRVGCVFNGGE